MKPKVAALVETLYHFNTSQAYDSIRSNAKLAEALLKDMNFVYPVSRHISPFSPKDTDPIPSIGSLGGWEASQSIPPPQHPKDHQYNSVP